MAHPLYVSPFKVVAVEGGGGICEMLISRSRFDFGVAGGVIRRNAGIIQCNRVFMLLEYKPKSLRTPSCLAELKTSELNHWSPCFGTPGTPRRWRGLDLSRQVALSLCVAHQVRKVTTRADHCATTISYEL